MRFTYLDDELATLRRLTSRTQSAASRVMWRRAMQARTTRTATVLRLVPRLVLGRTATRVKIDGAWVISSAGENGGVVLVIEARPHGSTLAELSAPVLVQVRRCQDVDLVLLRRLDVAGTVTMRMVDAP